MFYPIVTEILISDRDLSKAMESLSNVTQQTLTTSKEEKIARILNLVIRPVLIVFGTIGNGLSFHVMRQGSLKKMSTCFYLSILALADTSKCYKPFSLIHSSKLAFYWSYVNWSTKMHECGVYIARQLSNLL